MEPTEVVAEFIRAVNARDVPYILKYLSSDHVLIDPAGTEVHGHDALGTAWAEYLEMFPDYTIHVTVMLGGYDHVGVFGSAEGTYAPSGSIVPENHWSIPAAWLASVDGDKISRWRVFADTDPVRRIMDGDS